MPQTGIKFAYDAINGDSALLQDVNKIPKPDEPFKIVDEVGNTLNPHKQEGRVMATLNKEVKTTTGTLALVGLVPAFLAILITLGLNALGWARDDGASKERLIQTNADIQRMTESQKRIEDKLEKFDERLRAREVKDGETRGVKNGIMAVEGK